MRRFDPCLSSSVDYKGDEMISYLHIYLIHVSTWISLILAADVYKHGAPMRLDMGKNLVVSAVVLGLIGGLVSSHGHMHYLQLIKP
jgi:hypothetical protein